MCRAPLRYRPLVVVAGLSTVLPPTSDRPGWCPLLQRGADKDGTANHGRTPLHSAAACGHLAVVEVLLAAGAELNTLDPYGRAPLHVAAACGYFEIVCALLRQGADKESPTECGDTPLMVAASKGRLSVMEVLLEAGADVNIRSMDDSGYFFLRMAAKQGRVRILKAILSRGADYNAAGEDGCTPLHAAARADQAEAIEVLINAGADSALRASDGSTPLLKAASFTACEAMLALLRNGATVNYSDDAGYTALHWVCDTKQEGLEAAVDLLLRWGADEMSLDDDANTPAYCLSLVPWEDEGSELSQDEIERVRLLLTRAPADRAWRRRSWLIMISSRVSKARAAGCGAEDAPTNAGAASREMAKTESGVEETLGTHKSSSFRGGNGAGGQGKGLAGVVTALLELELEGVFRAVVSFL